MKRLISIKFVGLLLAAFAVTFFMPPSSAYAGWDDKSDELPGLHDFPTTLVVVGSVLVVGVLYLALKSKSDKKEKPAPPTDSDDSTDGPEAEPVEEDGTEEQDADVSAAVTLPSVRQHSRPDIGFYLGLDDCGPDFCMEDQARDFSDVTVKVGVTIGF